MSRSSTTGPKRTASTVASLAALALLPAALVVDAASAAPEREPAGSSLRMPEERATPRMRTVFRDNFDGRYLDTNKWAVYDGGDRRKENTFVRDGKLVLRTQRQAGGGWTAAGVSNARALKATYGRYAIRAKFERGWGVRAVALLWPAGAPWPPEVDFFEVNANDSARRMNNVTNHYRPGHQMEHRSYRGDFTKWHRIAVWWTPGRMVFRMDGKVRARITRNVPRQPMWLGLQTAAGGESAVPGARTPDKVDFMVDWVRIAKRR
jgi:beta-glucanase (GH16 family)